MRWLLRLCTVIGAVVLGLSLLGLFSVIEVARGKHTPAPRQFILTLALDGTLPEKPPEALLSNPFGKKKLSLHQIVEMLSRAEKDERVKGLAVKLEGAGLSVAHIQELRAAIRRLRAAGKPAWVYATSYGDIGTGLGSYYLAASFDEIWMQPLGTVSIAGIGMEMPYVRGLLDKVGVEPQFFQRKEYKTAFESFTRETMSPESREMMTAMIESVGGQILTEASADREISPDRFKALIDRGLLLGHEALEAGLIDKLDYEDVFVDSMRGALGIASTGDMSGSEAMPLFSIYDYKKSLPSRQGSEGRGDRTAAVTVALIPVTGTIVEGNPRSSGMAPAFMNEETASAVEIVKAIEEAVKDPAISALVVRIDSPGGSPVASESMRRALLKAAEKGKKVIVSMGTVAASGGYWVATAAERIFASPATLTGSIGVVGGKVSVAGLSGKLGVNWESVRWGRNADLWSLNAPFSESGAERINAMLDEVYSAFIERVATGRGMTREQVERVARGRVWTGEQAKAVGLVDELGGLDMALDYTARQLGLPDRSGLEVRLLPKPRTPLEELIEALGEESGATGVLARIALSIAGHPLFAPQSIQALTLDPALSAPVQ